jgi:hypothetical protein
MKDVQRWRISPRENRDKRRERGRGEERERERERENKCPLFKQKVRTEWKFVLSFSDKDENLGMKC